MDQKLAVLAVGAALLIGFGGGVLYSNQSIQPNLTEEQTLPSADSAPTSETDYYRDTTAVEPCSFFQCLFKANSQIIGYAELDGYYRAETVTGGGEEDAYAGITQTCDRFVVTGGSKPLVDQLLNNINLGNTLNKVDNGNLVINLNLGEPNLDPTLTASIRASTQNKPISLGVLQSYINGRGAGPCTSTLRIVNENRVITSGL